tara:strand:+ start:2998 stop:3201 length:204 start_codon:yes stop_codon:yes gene_type:complete
LVALGLEAPTVALETGPAPARAGSEKEALAARVLVVVAMARGLVVVAMARVADLVVATVEAAVRVST